MPGTGTSICTISHNHIILQGHQTDVRTFFLVIAFSIIIVGEHLVQITASVAVLVMGRCVICHWNRNEVNVQKIHGCILAYVTGSCNSRWRLTAILDYCFVDIIVKSHYNELKFCLFVSCWVIHVGLYFRECSF